MKIVYYCVVRDETSVVTKRTIEIQLLHNSVAVHTKRIRQLFKLKRSVESYV
jgi:hypothetical protein